MESSLYKILFGSQSKVFKKLNIHGQDENFGKYNKLSSYFCLSIKIDSFSVFPVKNHLFIKILCGAIGRATAVMAHSCTAVGFF